MEKVNSIGITLSTEDNKSKAILDFSSISSINEGDTIYLSIKNDTVDLTTMNSTSLFKWLDWIIASFNMLPNTTTVLSRDSSNLVVLGANTDDLNIELDLGEN
tara:strand:- start:20987 stop:21295 length:309 start_codon:yes stop_codon:yes gene_type:complete